MIETMPQEKPTRLSRKIGIIKEIASSLMAGAFVVTFLLAFGAFFFWGASLSNKAVFIAVVICTMIAFGMVAQTVATVGPLLLELWQVQAEAEPDEPLFP
jgi:hypothetical protein